MSRIAASHLLAEALRSAGVGVVVGEPLTGVVVREAPADTAAVLALAFERVGAMLSACHRGNQVVAIGSGPAGPSSTIESVKEVAPAILDAARRSTITGETIVVRLDVDLAEATDDRLLAAEDDSWGEPDEATLDAIRRAKAPIGLVGPAVLRRRQVPGLRSLATATNLGVVNTWGAKGAFHWRSRHHLATIGLQADDFALSGFGDADLVVTSGLDLLEAPPHLWAGPPCVDVGPSQLGPTAERLARGGDPIPTPAIRDRLVDVTVAGWTSQELPIAPSLLTRVYGEVVGPTGLVAADPGLAGFFVARTSGTMRPGGVLVPADGSTDGFAIAAVIANATLTPWHRAIAVIDDDSHPRVQALLELADRWSIPVVVDVWNADGQRLDAESHRSRLSSAARASGHTVAAVAFDRRQLGGYIEAAGPLISWPDRLSLL